MCLKYKKNNNNIINNKKKSVDFPNRSFTVVTSRFMR